MPHVMTALRPGRSLGALLLTILAGCTVGPDFVSPKFERKCRVANPSLADT